MPRKDRLIVYRGDERNIYLRKKPSTDIVKHLLFFLQELRQSAKTVINLFISVLGFTIPFRIANFEHFLIKEADSPYELNGKRIWMRQKLSSLRIENTTRQPM
jgi:hypothetical protein